MKSPSPRQPFISQDDGREYERLRGIEREYELETIAENAGQLVQYQAMSLRILAGLTSRTLGQLAGLTGNADGSRSVAADVRSLIADVDALAAGSNLSAVTPQLPASTPNDETSEDVQTVLMELLERVAKRYLKDQKALHQIAMHLRQAYEPPFLGMRNEAEKWLISGMKRTGRDREEDFDDSLRLLRASLDSPFGSGDYVAFFQLGWLLWQHEGSARDAEDAFYKAQRLSAEPGDLFYVKSLRHLAYMQYLQGNYEGAYEVAHKALGHHEDYEVRFEAARYAAMLGRADETIQLLNLCVRERPTTIITMFAEADFMRAPDGSKLLGNMADLASQLLEQARKRAAKNLQHWRMGLMVVESAEKLITHKIELPDDLGPIGLSMVTDVAQADYLMALEIDRRALTAGDKVLHVARDTLRREVRETASVLGKAQGELEKLEFSGRRRMTEALDWKEEQIRDMPGITQVLRGGGVVLRLLFPVFGGLIEWASYPKEQALLPELVKADPSAAELVTWLDAVYRYGSWLVYCYIIFGLVQLIDLVLRQKMRATIERVYEEVVRVDEAQSSGELGALRKTVWDATRRKQRAEEALRLIEPL
ncbi:MAG: tetratricopeptide repeat protein [Capsulimonadaceae bacterium]